MNKKRSAGSCFCSPLFLESPGPLCRRQRPRIPPCSCNLTCRPNAASAASSYKDAAAAALPFLPAPPCFFFGVLAIVRVPAWSTPVVFFGQTWGARSPRERECLCVSAFEFLDQTKGWALACASVHEAACCALLIYMCLLSRDVANSKVARARSRRLRAAARLRASGFVLLLRTRNDYSD